MPSSRPHNDGWVRVTRTTAWAAIHPHLLLTDPAGGRTGLIRIDKLLANALYGVHVGAGKSTDKTLGSDNLSLGFIDDCFEELVRLGMPRQPQDSRDATKRACADAMLRDPAVCTPRHRDWYNEVEPIHGGRAQQFDLLPYAAPAGSNGSLSEISDIFLYGANFLCAADRTYDGHTAGAIRFLTQQLEEHDGALREMPPKDKGQRLLALMAHAQTPPFLELQSDSVEEVYAKVDARVKWTFGSEVEKERVLLEHSLELLRMPEANELQDLLLKGARPVKSSLEAAELIKRLARLVKSSAFEQRHLKISSLDAVRNLNAFLAKHRAIYTRDAALKLPPGDRVGRLEQRQEMQESSWRGGADKASGGSLGFPREMSDVLDKELSTRAVLDLEDKIESMLQLPDMDGKQAFELCYLITVSRQSIMLKVLLGHISWLHVKPAYGKVIAQIRPHWNRFATLVLVAGTEAWRRCTDRQMDFELPAAVLDRIKTCSTKVSIIDDIYTPIAKGVLKAAKLPTKGDGSHLLDDFLRGKERQFGERMFWLLGYQAEAEAEAAEADTGDSFAAVVDNVTEYLEMGAPLGGQRAETHQQMALNFYQKARKEHQQVYDWWANSKDPSHKHPSRWLPVNAVCKATITANKNRLTKLLDIADYAPEVLSGTALAATPEGFYACGRGFYALAHD